jgi:hypothetical protein
MKLSLTWRPAVAQVSTDLIDYLFNAYLLVDDYNFKKYIKRKKEDYDDEPSKEPSKQESISLPTAQPDMPPPTTVLKGDVNTDDEPHEIDFDLEHLPLVEDKTQARQDQITFDNPSAQLLHWHYDSDMSRSRQSRPWRIKDGYPRPLQTARLCSAQHAFTLRQPRGHGKPERLLIA